MKKNLLFVMSRPPYGSIHVQETLDVIMTAAAFDQKVSLLFVDDGVFQLKRGQRPGVLALKDVTPIFAALALYEVDSIFVEAESLEERGLHAEELNLPARMLPRAELGAWIGSHDVVLNG